MPLKVTLDGKELDIKDGETLDGLIRIAGVEVEKGCLISVRRKVKEERVETNLYEIQTTRGRMVLRVECRELLEEWKRSCKGFEGTGVRWVTRDAAVFGPAVFDLKPSIEPVSLGRYEATLSLSGLSGDNTHLVLSRRPHSSSYYPPEGCNALGRIVYGRHLVNLLKMGDKILSVKPVLEFKEEARSLIRGEPGLQLEEGDRISTRISVDLDYDSPVCGEQAYNIFEGGAVRISSTSSRYICNNEKKVIFLAQEKIGIRKRGVITIRNAGENLGAIYIYKKDAPIAQSHTIVGRVAGGMELADLATEGDLIAVEVNPPRLNILGMSVADARRFLEGLKIKLEPEGGLPPADGGIVVEHEPQNSLEIYKKGIVRCKAISPESIIKIRLYEAEAPRSVKYFRAVTGLEKKPFGRLSVYFATPKAEMILFKGNGEIAKGLTPENIPSGKVLPGHIGITNTVKKFVGMIGIRLTESERFGPTAESFDGTNIIGEVLGGLEALRRLRDGDVVYLKEAKA